VAVLVEAMTDNRNRTAGDVRSLFTKYGGNLGAEGCVGWMFEESGEILVAYDTRIREETLFEAAIEAGAQDFEPDLDARVYRIKATPDDLNTVATALNQHPLRFPVDNVASIRTPQTQAEVATFEQAYNLVRLLNALEDLDDVRAVHNNADIPDALYEQVEKKLMAFH
jgi:transcriptional/translational regulatory protein YebC/TACO1